MLIVNYQLKNEVFSYFCSMKKILFFVFIFVFVFVSVPVSLSAHDNIEFSLLTCYPGNNVYSLYGHTAIRYQNKTRSEDLAFNYGVFNFKQKLFVWNFALGKTDYELGVYRFQDFLHEYRQQGRRVVEQVLNMTDEQKELLRFLLFENWRPENATYRYNYFYDNCTTRARNIIFAAINSDTCQIQFTSSPHEKCSWRETLHQYSANHPWAQIGNDLALGQPADNLMTEEEQQFLPLNMMDYMNRAVVVNVNDNDNPQPLILSTNIISEGRSKEHVAPYKKEFVLTPLQCAAIFALICIMIFMIEVKRRKTFLWFDILLMLLQGLAGCVLTLLLFSDHPAICMNWQILVICPLALLFIPAYIITRLGILNRKSVHTSPTLLKLWLQYEALACIAIFIIDITGIQDIPLFTEIIALCLLTRVISNSTFKCAQAAGFKR